MASSREAYGIWDVNVGATLASTREGTGIWDENVGVTLASARAGYGIWDENVGVTLASTREGTGIWDENVLDGTPTPHIWWLWPSYGREGWEFKIVGSGFGTSQAQYDGFVTLVALGCAVIDWTIVPATGDPPFIDPETDTTTMEHGQIRVVVPPSAVSGLVVVTTDGP